MASAAPSEPLAAARAALAAANAACEAAAAEAAKLQEPANRAARVKGDLVAAQEKHTKLKAAFDIDLGQWLTSGGAGARPEPGEELLAVERRIIALAQDAAAVEKIHPELEQASLAASRQVAAVFAAREDVFYRVALEVGIAYIAAEYSARLRALLETELVIVSLISTLYSSPGGPGTADQIHNRLRAAKEFGLPRNSDIGARFLARLRADPHAELK